MIEQKIILGRRAFISGVIACGAASLLLPQTLWADEVETKQAEADAALRQLQDMQSELDRASNSYYRALEAQASAELQMADAQMRIDAETATILDCQQQLARRAREMYRAGGNTFLDVLLGSATFEDFANNWSILNLMNESDAALVKRSKESRQALSNARTSYAIQRETARHEAEQARIVQSNALATVTSMQAVYDSLSAEAMTLVAQSQAQQATVTDPATIAALVQQATAEVETADWVPAPEEQAAMVTAALVAQQAAAQEAAAAAAAESAPAAAPDPTPVATPEPAPATTTTQTATTPATTTVTPTVSGSTVGERAVSVALQYLGMDYVWGGKSVDDGGFDCSGLVSNSYSMAGSYAPSYTGSLIDWGQEVDEPQIGDVCVIHEEDGSQHTGLYYGDGTMIHAATYGVGVIIGPVQEGMTYRRLE